MDNTEDELRFNFRNPFYSDEDTYSNSSLGESDGSNCSCTSRFHDDMDLDAFDRNFGNKQYTTPDTECKIIVGKTKESRIIVPFFQASHVTSALSEGQQKQEGNSSEHDCEGTNSGAQSTFQVDEIDLSAALASCNHNFFNGMPLIEEEKTRKVHWGQATVVDEPLLETSLSNRLREEMLPMFRTKITQEEEETAELGHREGTSTEPDGYSVKVAAPSDEMLEEHVIADPAMSRETKDGIARSRTSQKKILDPGILEDSTGESLRQTVTRQTDEIDGRNDIFLHPATSDLIQTLRTEYRRLLTESSSFKRSSTRGHIGLSCRERMRARLLDPYHYEKRSICLICGSQQGEKLPRSCIICSSLGSGDDQKFVLLKDLHDDVHIKLSNSFHPVEADLTFQIFENFLAWKHTRAFLLKLPNGNILWDCISYIDEETVIKIAMRGGVKAIAISSPDHMGTCARMSYIFNKCPIYVHESDRFYFSKVVSKTARRFWNTSREYLWDGVTLIHLGGHFPGSCILHFDHKDGIIFSGNTLKVGEDGESVSVMLDYILQHPASLGDVERILLIMEELEFDQLYGDQPGDNIVEHAKSKVLCSLNRYIDDVLKLQLRKLTRIAEDALQLENHQLRQRARHGEDTLQLENHQSRHRAQIAMGKRKVGDT